MSSQKVYVLINEAMPWYVKIGYTEQSLEDRVRGLDTTWVPLPFEVFYAAEVADMYTVERLLHDAFRDKRVRKNREFFEIAPEQVVSAIRLAELKNITPTTDYVESFDDQKALDEARKKRENFNFKMVDVPVWATLVFTHDETIICTIRDNKKVLFNGEEKSLSWAASEALKQTGRYRKSVQGPSYWMYEWETLTERRMRYEEL